MFLHIVVQGLWNNWHFVVLYMCCYYALQARLHVLCYISLARATCWKFYQIFQNEAGPFFTCSHAVCRCYDCSSVVRSFIGSTCSTVTTSTNLIARNVNNSKQFFVVVFVVVWSFYFNFRAWIILLRKGIWLFTRSAECRKLSIYKPHGIVCTFLRKPKQKIQTEQQNYTRNNDIIYL